MQKKALDAPDTIGPDMDKKVIMKDLDDSFGKVHPATKETLSTWRIRSSRTRVIGYSTAKSGT